MPGYKDGFLIGQQNSENYSLVKGIGTVGDGKYGCVNKYGNIMIDPAYDNITYEGGYKFALTTGTKQKPSA